MLARAAVSGLLAAMFAAPGSLFACAACYGKADGPMAQAMNWGIFSLLAVIVMVLVGVAAFFVFLVKRAAKLAAAQPAGEVAEAVGRI